MFRGFEQYSVCVGCTNDMLMYNVCVIHMYSTCIVSMFVCMYVLLYWKYAKCCVQSSPKCPVYSDHVCTYLHITHTGINVCLSMFLDP